MDPLPLLDTPLSQMATTRNKYILHLEEESKQHRDKIQRLTSKIASTNSKFANFEANVIGKFATIKGELASLTTALNQWLKQSHGSPSSE
jgi:predicted  nucleic acid-binding Zn-ribbon protein